MTIQEIQVLLIQNLPGKFFYARERKTFCGDYFIAINIAKDYFLINGIEWQYAEHVSLSLQDWILEYQAYNGSGGRSIYRKPNKSLEGEKYLALGSEKMPAIRIKDTRKSLLKICNDYMEIVEKIEKDGLTYTG